MWDPPSKSVGSGAAPVVDCGTEFFSMFGLVSSGEQDAISVILGENSWNYMGTNVPLRGQTLSGATGPTIGVEDVYLEDQMMADVLLNRVSQWGGSLSSVATAKGQFLGYSAGQQMFKADMLIGADTSPCSDLLTAFSALRSQETGTRINSSVLYWASGFNQRTGKGRKRQI